MRLAAIPFLLVLFCIGCKEEQIVEDYTGYTETSFYISGLSKDSSWRDSLAKVTLKIPTDLDTFYNLRPRSDLENQLQYRFGDKKYVQFAESGFYAAFAPDSLLQLTFMHDPLVDSKNRSSVSSVKPVDTTHLPTYLANHRTSCDQFNFIKKEYKIIHGRPFILTAFTSDCSVASNKPTLVVGAITTLKKMHLFIVAETSARDTTGFITRIEKSIRSIEISERK